MTGTSRWWATESVLLRNGWKRNMACSEIKNGVFVSVFLSPRAYPLTKFLFLRSFVEGVLSHSQLIRSATDFPTWPFLVICIVRRYPHPSYGIFLYEMPYPADFWYLFFDWFWLRIWSCSDHWKNCHLFQMSIRIAYLFCEFDFSTSVSDYADSVKLFFLFCKLKKCKVLL